MSVPASRSGRRLFLADERDAVPDFVATPAVAILVAMAGRPRRTRRTVAGIVTDTPPTAALAARLTDLGAGGRRAAGPGPALILSAAVGAVRRRGIAAEIAGTGGDTAGLGRTIGRQDTFIRDAVRIATDLDPGLADRAIRQRIVATEPTFAGSLIAGLPGAVGCRRAPATAIAITVAVVLLVLAAVRTAFVAATAIPIVPSAQLTITRAFARAHALPGIRDQVVHASERDSGYATQDAAAVSRRDEGSDEMIELTGIHSTLQAA